MKKMTAVVVSALLSACTDPHGAEQAVEAMGMTDVTITGYRWTGCGKDDDQRTGYQATNIHGQRIEGVVCGNWTPFGKSNTVRIDRVVATNATDNNIPVRQ